MGRAVRDRVRNNNYQGELADPARNPYVWSVSDVEFRTPTLSRAPRYVILGASAHGKVYWAWAPTSLAHEIETCFLNYLMSISPIETPQPIIESRRFDNRSDLLEAFPELPMYQVFLDGREG